jgi:hypothetical protein
VRATLLPLAACGPDPTARPTDNAPAPPELDALAFTPEPMPSVPLLGGTLEVVAPFLLAADPPADRLVRLGLADLEVEILGLGDGARPFRIAPAGPDAFVTLRGTGEVARIDVADLGCAPTLLDRLVGPQGLHRRGRARRGQRPGRRRPVLARRVAPHVVIASSRAMPGAPGGAEAGLRYPYRAPLSGTGSSWPIRALRGTVGTCAAYRYKC